jgi:iron-sulfur cluster assembly protein
MINLTDTALTEVKRLMAERQAADQLLRFAVKNGGCSGMTYSMDFDALSGENDRVFDLGDVRVVCDQESLRYLDGLTVDFSRALMGGGFKFLNPNASRSCGCGTSFRV